MDPLGKRRLHSYMSTRHLSFCFVTVLFTVGTAGVFWGAFRFDELYFSNQAWNIYKYNDNPLHTYLPPLFPILFSYAFKISDGNLFAMLGIRCLNYILALSMIAMIYFIICKVFTIKIYKLNQRIIAYCVTASIVFYICGIRGFELRPEALGNISLLTGSVYIFFHNVIGSYKKRTLLLAICLLSLWFSALLSLRYSLPCFFIGYAIVVMHFGSRRYLRTNKKVKRIFLAAPIAIVALVAFTHITLFDISELLQLISAYENRQGDMSLYDKLFGIGIVKGGNWAFLNLYRVVWVFLVSSLGAIVLFQNITTKQYFTVAAVFLMLASLFSFYALYFIESRPFNYVLSIETILLLILFLYFYQQSIHRISYFYALLSIVMLVAVVLGSGARLQRFRSPQGLFHNAMSAYHDRSALQSMDIKNLHDTLLDRNSILSQIYIREEICDRMDTYKVVVNNYDGHPVCIKDEDSLDIMKKNRKLADLKLLQQFNIRNSELGYIRNLKVGYY